MQGYGRIGGAGAAPGRAAQGVRLSPRMADAPGGVFARSLTTAAPEPGGVAPLPPAGAVPLLVLPAVDGASRDASARRHAESILDDLRDLQRQLLGPESAPAERQAALQRLSARLRENAAQADDPALQDAIASIALRAAVELARYEVGRR